MSRRADAEPVRHRRPGIGARLVSSLRMPSYRRYFVGQQLAQIGQWTQVVAEVWLVYELSGGSATSVGLISAARFAPALVFGPWIGVYVDRRLKRRVLMSCAAGTVATSATIGTVVVLDLATFPVLAALCFVAGTLAAIEVTARHVYALEVAGRDNAGNAAALHGAAFNVARVLGPLCGGVLIAHGAIAVCFLGAAAAYTWAWVSLARLGRAIVDAPPETARRGQAREGLRYLAGHRELRRTVVLTGWCFALSTNFNVILPVLASRDLAGSADTFSQLMIAMGVGALLALPVAATRHTYGRALVIAATYAFGAAMVVALLPSGIVAVLIALTLVGATELLFMTSVGTFIQLRTDPQLLGRVLAMRAVVTQGMVPIGSVLTGIVVDRLGAAGGIGMGAAALLVGATVYSLLGRRAPRREREADPQAGARAAPSR